MIVFITSIFDELKTPIYDFIKSSSGATIVYGNVPASALDNVVTFECEVLFERMRPTSIKPEPTLGDRIDLRVIMPTWRTLHSERERSKSIPHFQLDKTSLEVSKQIDDDYRIDQELRTGKYSKSLLLSCFT